MDTHLYSSLSLKNSLSEGGTTRIRDRRSMKYTMQKTHSAAINLADTLPSSFFKKLFEGQKRVKIKNTTKTTNLNDAYIQSKRR